MPNLAASKNPPTLQRKPFPLTNKSSLGTVALTPTLSQCFNDTTKQTNIITRVVSMIQHNHMSRIYDTT